MSPSLIPVEERGHPPARSATPAAWMALALLASLAAGWIFFDSIICSALRMGLAALAWNQRAQLSVDRITFSNKGTIQAEGMVLTFGSPEHRSSWKSDRVEIRLSSVGDLAGFSRKRERHLIQEVLLGKTKLLLDRRGIEEVTGDTTNTARLPYAIPWMSFLPAACTAGPVDLVAIGDTWRVSASGLSLTLPDRWAGKVWYSEVVMDIGSAHQVFPATSSPASWNGSTLRIGELALAKELELEEVTLSLHGERLEFGVRGEVGGGLLRGDGSMGLSKNSTPLDATLVGENLQIEALSALVKQDDQLATGTVRQGRWTFRGDPARPLEADCSLRLVADAFRWKGRGWDSLRISSILTGRVLTLSELSLHQKENEVEAEGESKLPEDWHAALQAPFSATFHAQLEDAGALAALAGPDFAQLSGGLILEGAIKGAENKANGYCNLLGTEMKVRNLPVDWLRGCLLFEGEKTSLSYLEAWSGEDRIVIGGTVENSSPHTYSATAEFGVGNLTKRLAQLGVSTASQIGGGAVEGTWQGDGSVKGHSGAFHAKVTRWISPWTMAGMSGNFEGTYSPGHLYCSKAEFQQSDLRLDLRLSASPKRLEAKSIMATRAGKPDPLVEGDVSIPVDAPTLWQTGDLVSNLRMGDPISLGLSFHGIKAEELADLLGQHLPATGTLEGDLTASGTPQAPEIHSTLKVARLTLPDSSSVKGLIWNFDSTAGRATCKLVQEPLTNAPLTIHAELPFRLMAYGGALHFADPAASVKAGATLHGVALNGWTSLWSGTSGLRDGTLDGSLTLGGTLDKPSVQGGLLLAVRELRLPGLPGLRDVKLPITCSISKASASGGTALYGEKTEEKPLALSGTLEWHNHPWDGHLDLSGKDLSFPGIGEIKSRGDAEVSLSVQGTNAPTLSGTLVIRNITGTLPSVVTPFFSPPGFWLSSLDPLFQGDGGTASWPQVSLDLKAKTAGALAFAGASNAPGASLQADLALQGCVSALRWTGKITARNQMIDLPAGSFVVPEVILQCGDGVQQQLSFKAFGMTRLGFCTIEQDGPADSTPWFEAFGAPPDATASDMMLALATARIPGANPSLLSQTGSWIRQNTLFPVTPVGWITRSMGNNEVGSLGFYGNPWSMSLQQALSSAQFFPGRQEASKN